VSAGWLTLSAEINNEASASALASSEPGHEAANAAAPAVRAPSTEASNIGKPNVGVPGVADDADTELQGMLALAWGGDESWDVDGL
jgi:hypothetical protein